MNPEAVPASRRGTLRIYLGAAPGVGKTHALLSESHRRRARGTDIVVAFAETHGRPHTEEEMAGLETLPRNRVVWRGSQHEELDLNALLARHPQVAVVDDLAHTNAPGSGRHSKRWQDVEKILEAGVDVITAIGVEHLESLSDVVEAITGVEQHETVPDAVVRAADQVELLDMSPEALRRRLAHGNIYRPEKIDAALHHYFRLANLTALRELALLWLADNVEEGLQRYRQLHKISGTWETRERVVVALTGGPEGETLIRRGSRIAARTVGGEVLAVHVSRIKRPAGPGAAVLAELRQLVESLGGSYHVVVGDDVAQGLLDFAAGVHATQIVVGVSRRRRRVAALTGPGTGATVARTAGAIDVHIVGHDYAGKGRGLPKLARGLTPRRRYAGLLTAALLLCALTPTCTALHGHLSLDSVRLLYLTAVLAVSLIGGLYPAIACAAAATVLVDWYFQPPTHHLQIHNAQNLIALVVFLTTAAMVSRVTDLAARRSSQAARATAEAETVAALASSLLAGERALPALLDRVRETFNVSSVALLHHETTAPASAAAAIESERASGLRGSWRTLASTGPDPCRRPEDSETEVPMGEGLVLALSGRVLPAHDRRVLAAFANNVAVAYQQRQLAEAAEAAAPLAASDRLRSALLSAVSHDLRTPLSIAKTALAGLRSPDLAWSAAEQSELLTTADTAIDRVTALVTNLLDLSRLQAGALPVLLGPVGIDDVVARALDQAAHGHVVDLDVPPDLPPVLADAGLLERVVANLVENAMRYAPTTALVRVAASSHAERVQLRVVDRGPGIPAADRERVFAPFQRAGDHAAGGAGVGLGLAIARGIVQAMGGTLCADDTPGGGATLVVDLPTAGPALTFDIDPVVSPERMR
jgi:two-component system, OmpR family, sensor histidine kinase KdpD